MYAILSALFFSLSMQLTGANELPPIVPTVNLSRYLGKWYEIARFPNSFQKDSSRPLLSIA
jgi:apolipoprotein D and lipocalin family protein